MKLGPKMSEWLAWPNCSEPWWKTSLRRLFRNQLARYRTNSRVV